MYASGSRWPESARKRFFQKFKPCSSFADILHGNSPAPAAERDTAVWIRNETGTDLAVYGAPCARSCGPRAPGQRSLREGRTGTYPRFPLRSGSRGSRRHAFFCFPRSFCPRLFRSIRRRSYSRTAKWSPALLNMPERRLPPFRSREEKRPFRKARPIPERRERGRKGSRSR